MARCVTDIAAIMNVITGTDREDSATSAAEDHRCSDYVNALQADALQDARLGVARECFSNHKGTLDVIEKAIATLRQLARGNH